MSRVERFGWWMWVAIFGMLLVLGAATSRAGEVRLSWSPAASGPPATGFWVYTGTEPGIYGPEVDVGGVLFHLFTTLPNCQTGF